MVQKAVRNVKFDFEDVDRDLDSTKLKIPNFQRKKDLEVYLEWGEKVDWIFFITIAIMNKKGEIGGHEFTKYALIWWDQIVISRRRNRERLVRLGGR
jgi:hypothetical protein